MLNAGAATIEKLTVSECSSSDAIAATWQVMRQLRPHLQTLETYTALVAGMQSAHGYRLAGAFQKGVCLGVAGFTLETRLFCGKILYVADLVVDGQARSGGVGRRIMDWLKREAAVRGCAGVRLDSGVQRAGAHRFYFREGFSIDCYSFYFNALES